jgi:hypothetical protein
MNRYLFDFAADCCLRVSAADEAVARQLLAGVADGNPHIFGTFPDGSLAMGEVSLNNHRAVLISINDVPTDASRFDLHASHVQLTKALEEAESFISGFEGDELQEGINEKLATIRAALAYARGETLPAVP